MDRYRVAIIGAGPRAVDHCAADVALPDVEMVAVASPTPTRRDALAARFGLRAYGDVADMLRTEQPDLVHVVTPPSVRVDILRLLAEYGVPAATVEKPIALGVADHRALSELVDGPTRIGVCHQFRWYPSLVRCREALASGRLGRVLMVDASAGMDITNQGTHALHYGNALNGDRRVVEVFGTASGWNLDDPAHPGPEDSLGQLTLDDGSRMVWATGPRTPRVGDPSTTWQHVRVAAHAELGRVEWAEFGGWAIVGPDGMESGEFEGFPAWQQGNMVAQAAFHAEMLTWLRDAEQPCGTNLARSLHEWQAVLALYASALERRPIRLDQFAPSDDLVGRLKATLTA